MAATGQRRRVLLWSAVFGYSGLAFTLARNVLLVPLYLHYIDLGEYGAWLATGGALVQLLVTDFGLSGVLTQRVAAQAGGRNTTGLRALAGAGLANALILAIGLTALSSLLAFALPATQGLADAQVTRVLDCFVLALLANGCGVLSAAALAIVRGAQRPIAAGAVALGADVASVTVTLFALAKGLGLYAIALGLLARSVLAAIAGIGVVARVFADHPGRWRPRLADSLAMWRDSARFFATSIAMRLQTQANILAVGTFLGPHAAAVYGLTVRAHETVHIIVGQLNSSFGPVLAHLAGAGDHRRLASVIHSLLLVAAALAAVGAGGVIVLNEAFVRLWAGSDAFGGAWLTVLMGVALWITSLAYVGYEALLARGEFALIARAFAVSSVLHVLVLVTAVRALGAWAAPLALVVSSSCWGALLWRRWAGDTGMSAGQRGALVREVAIIGALGVLGAALCSLLPAARSWVTLLVEAALVAALMAGLLLGARPTLRRLLREEIGSTLRAARAT